MGTWQKDFSELLNVRDRFDLQKRDLYADYASISKRRPTAAFATAIRNQSLEYLDVLAMEATSNKYLWEELRDLVSYEYASDGIAGVVACLFGKNSEATCQAKPIEDIARLLLLSDTEPKEKRVGAWLLSAVNKVTRADRKNKRARLLEVQYVLSIGDRDRAEELLRKWKDIRLHEYSYLQAELVSPFRDPAIGEVSEKEFNEWLERFNKVFLDHGLWPVSLDEKSLTPPFDGLEVRRKNISDISLKEVQKSPLVSVVITAFQPELRQLVTSVRSLLAQTLSDIEVIIVDDSSGPNYSDVFKQVETMDARIKVIHLETNSGTYAARNVGLSVAKGEFYTGQDDDDWSHPQRLEKQVNFMRQTPTAIGCRVDAVLCKENLSRLRLGYKSVNSNASSLMVRTKDLKMLGGFLETRKAADTELAKRLEHRFQLRVETISQPLTVVRILSDSLSRSEFSAGWSHPARNQFKSSYSYWHSNAGAKGLEVVPHELPQISVPRRFELNGGTDRHYQVVLAGDWRKFGGPQKSMMEEIHALKASGISVAILHLEAGRFMTTKVEFLAPQIQELINSGYVDEVLFDDAVDIDLLILRYPPILQFMAEKPTELRIKKMFITANQAPSELDGSDIRYLVRDCHRKAEKCFKTNVSWVPQGPQVRESIQSYLSQEELEDFDFPGILSVSDWRTSIPRAKRGKRPVIGRHSRDDAMKWPESKELLKLAYPEEGEIEVRVMGGGKTPLKILNAESFPRNWCVLERDEEEVSDFLNTLDFYVFFQNSQAVEAFGRSVLEAIAANLVVILPHQYQEVFGKAAIYCEIGEVQDVVRKYYEDWELYTEQQRLADEALRERFDRTAFSSKILNILKELR